MAADRASRHTILHMVPPEGRPIYKSILRALLGPINPLVWLTVAKLVCHELDRAELAEAARKAGLATEAGAKLHERARIESERAERLAVTAHDLALGPGAQRSAKASPKKSKVDEMRVKAAEASKVEDAKGADDAA